MARPIRVEFEDAVYHVTARGNERKPIYRDDRDRERFLETLEEAVKRFRLVIHPYCLMPNHFHLLAQTPRANLSDAAGWLQTTYSIGFNRRHRRSGHLSEGRFKAHLVEEDAYARELIKTIHLNPLVPGQEKTGPAGAEERVDELSMEHSPGLRRAGRDDSAQMGVHGLVELFWPHTTRGADRVSPADQPDVWKGCFFAMGRSPRWPGSGR